MSTLFNVVFAWKCSSTHHKMAMDALDKLRSPQAERWRDLCLGNVDKYLEGSKAPDNKFKDFRNHVMHVRENYWGGAVASATRWYDETVAALKTSRWADAVYAAGVLSHYYTDPIQPLHTAQCEAEGVIHQACEWSIACAYRDLTTLLESDLGGWPNVNVPNGADWLNQMVTQGAELANPHYEACLAHYNLANGAKDPPRGLDQDLRIRFARLIGHAVVGYARIMDRALEDSQARIPATNLTLQSVITTIKIPILWVTKKLTDSKERALVEFIYREFQQTGKVISALSDDDKAIREVHAAEVRRISKPELDAESPIAIGSAHGTLSLEQTQPQEAMRRQMDSASAAAPQETSLAANATPAANGMINQQRLASAGTSSLNPLPLGSPIAKSRTAGTTAKSGRQTLSNSDRYYLDESMDVEKAPSIGPKSAARLAEFGVKSVHDLLRANSTELATQINDRNFKKETIVEWQIQAGLCCDVPNLRGHDAQILTATGIKNCQELSTADPASLLERVEAFVVTSAGQRILRGSTPPDRAEINDWITWAQNAARPNAA